MPQMFPLNWILLFYYFITILFLFNILMYYNNTNTTIFNKMKFKIKKINWKW